MCWARGWDNADCNSPYEMCTTRPRLQLHMSAIIQRDFQGPITVTHMQGNVIASPRIARERNPSQSPS